MARVATLEADLATLQSELAAEATTREAADVVLQNDIEAIAVTQTTAYSALGAARVLQNQFTPIVSLTLPPGSYVFIGKVKARASVAAARGMGCQLTDGVDAIDGATGAFVGGVVNWQFDTPVLAAADFASEITIWIQCRADEVVGEQVIVDSGRLVAVSVGALHEQ